MAGIVLTTKEKVEVAKMLDALRVYQIEAGIPAMGGEEKKSVAKIAALGLRCKVSAWNRMHIQDIEHSLQCGVDMVHISVPTSDLHIQNKLQKDRVWVINQLRRCVSYAQERGAYVTIGLEDASRADPAFLRVVGAAALLEGAKRVRYADTVGILHRHRIVREIPQLHAVLKSDLEIHCHNDLGLAVSNSFWAVKAGVRYVDSTIGGMGERAGNCDLYQMILACRECPDIWLPIEPGMVLELEQYLRKAARRYKG